MVVFEDNHFTSANGCSNAGACVGVDTGGQG